MPRYRVDSTTRHVERYSIEIEAESEAEAERMSQEFPFADWEVLRNTRDTTVKIYPLPDKES